MPELRAIDKELLYNAFMEAFSDYQMDASGTTEEHLLLRMEKNAVDYEASVGAYSDGHLVGFTMIGIDTICGVRTAFDAGTGIIPGFRKQGLAKQMFDHALPGLRDLGVTRFLLEVLHGNNPAIKAYTKSGFEIVRELRCYAAEPDNLRDLPETRGLQIESIGTDVYRKLVADADWTPSFENRFTAIDAIPEHVSLFGAFDGETCIGTLAYAPALNWLLTLVVGEGHRMRGGGRALIRHLARTLPALAKRLVAINVDGSDDGMQAFFQSIGFTHLVDQYEMARAIV